MDKTGQNRGNWENREHHCKVAIHYGIPVGTGFTARPNHRDRLEQGSQVVTNLGFTKKEKSHEATWTSAWWNNWRNWNLQSELVMFEIRMAWCAAGHCCSTTVPFPGSSFGVGLPASFSPSVSLAADVHKGVAAMPSLDPLKTWKVPGRDLFSVSR